MRTDDAIGVSLGKVEGEKYVPALTADDSRAGTRVRPQRLSTSTASPSAIARRAASSGWISSTSTGASVRLGVRRVMVPTL